MAHHPPRIRLGSPVPFGTTENDLSEWDFEGYYDIVGIFANNMYNKHVPSYQ